MLASIMFTVYIDDMTERVSSYMNMFANDAKLQKRMRNKEDCEMIQRDFDKLLEWRRKWEMDFNINRVIIELKVIINWGTSTLTRTEEKDLGIAIPDNVSRLHINKITADTYNLLRNIRVAFKFLDEDIIRKLIVTIIWPSMYESVDEKCGMRGCGSGVE